LYRYDAAIAGFRDASLVTTPPPERRPINTTLQMYDHKTVHEVGGCTKLNAVGP
jgi:transcription-repair coupling factor (superfamily II helicase)